MFIYNIYSKLLWSDFASLQMKFQTGASHIGRLNLVDLLVLCILKFKESRVLNVLLA